MATHRRPRKVDSSLDLSVAELTFARAFAATGNAHHACREAGLSRTAHTALLTRPPVVAEIRRIRSDARAHQQAIFDWIVRELATLAGANLADLLDDRGLVKPPGDVSRDAMATLASYKLKTNPRGGHDVEVSQHDKLKAMGMLLSMFGLTQQRHEVSVVGPDGQAAHLSTARVAVERALLTDGGGDGSDS